MGICIQVPPYLPPSLASSCSSFSEMQFTRREIQLFAVYDSVVSSIVKSCESSPGLQKIFISLERNPKFFSNCLPTPVPDPQVTINPRAFYSGYFDRSLHELHFPFLWHQHT